MAKMVVAEPKDGKVLLDKLKLEALKERPNSNGDINNVDLHRVFHYEVCKWLQEQGYEVI